jgi:hypothetical protein
MLFRIAAQWVTAISFRIAKRATSLRHSRRLPPTDLTGVVLVALIGFQRAADRRGDRGTRFRALVLPARKGQRARRARLSSHRSHSRYRRHARLAAAALAPALLAGSDPGRCPESVDVRPNGGRRFRLYDQRLPAQGRATVPALVGASASSGARSHAKLFFLATRQASKPLPS